MPTFLRKFSKSELGAVTADWVVLTAIVTCLVCAAYVGVEGGTGDLASKIQSNLVGVAVGG